MSTANKFLIGLLTGAAVGAAAGILMAPKVGKETRQIVGERATQAKQKAGDYVGALRQRIKKEGDPQGVK